MRLKDSEPFPSTSDLSEKVAYTVHSDWKKSANPD
jgi:hypothetical protein